jgi:HAD superfamily hydrolase (TIGR01484 family)
MPYKALIFDLDGTAIDTKEDAFPTERTIDVIKRAKKYVSVSVATGRLHYNSKYILDAFGITNPCVFAGGSLVKNPITNEIVWSKQMSALQVGHILEVCKQYPYRLYFSEDQMLYLPNDKAIQSEMIVYVNDIPKDKTEELLNRLRSIPEIAPHSTGSWKNGCLDIHITHKDSTKKNGLSHLLEYLKVKREEVMVVGDTGNDIPLFESGGLKVAMGNATEELKQKSVYEDGLAYAVEKYILEA